MRTGHALAAEIYLSTRSTVAAARQRAVCRRSLHEAVADLQSSTECAQLMLDQMESSKDSTGSGVLCVRTDL